MLKNVQHCQKWWTNDNGNEIFSNVKYVLKNKNLFGF